MLGALVGYPLDLNLLPALAGLRHTSISLQNNHGGDGGGGEEGLRSLNLNLVLEGDHIKRDSLYLGLLGKSPKVLDHNSYQTRIWITLSAKNIGPKCD